MGESGTSGQPVRVFTSTGSSSDRRERPKAWTSDRCTTCGARENREWQELINTFTDAMSRGIRLLGGCERTLSARNTLKIDALQHSHKRIADAELGVDVALQHFLKRIFDDAEPGQKYVRPYSVKEVEAIRMQRAVRDRTEREQERAVAEKAREEGRRVRQTAEANMEHAGERRTLQ